jgi:uncharacterized protein (DUF305 family)
MKLRLASAAAVLLLAMSSGAFAQATHSHQHGAKAAQSPSAKAYSEAMDKMHGPMMEGMKAADPDVAFVRGMIPHHQGAIDMAKVVMQYGKDPEIRKLAEAVIREQQREIGEMQEWLKKNAR